MTGHLNLVKATLSFLIYYLVVGVIWYVVEVKISPLVASAVTCPLALPVLWLPSRFCLRSPGSQARQTSPAMGLLFQGRRQCFPWRAKRNTRNERK